jgi:hypothetical protein
MPAVFSPVELTLAARHGRDLPQVDKGEAVVREDTRDLDSVATPAAGRLPRGPSRRV